MDKQRQNVRPRQDRTYDRRSAPAKGASFMISLGARPVLCGIAWWIMGKTCEVGQSFWVGLTFFSLLLFIEYLKSDDVWYKRWINIAGFTVFLGLTIIGLAGLVQTIEVDVSKAVADDMKKALAVNTNWNYGDNNLHKVAAIIDNSIDNEIRLLRHNMQGTQDANLHKASVDTIYNLWTGLKSIQGLHNDKQHLVIRVADDFLAFREYEIPLKIFWYFIGGITVFITVANFAAHMSCDERRKFLKNKGMSV